MKRTFLKSIGELSTCIGAKQIVDNQWRRLTFAVDGYDVFFDEFTQITSIIYHDVLRYLNKINTLLANKYFYGTDHKRHVYSPLYPHVCRKRQLIGGP